MSFDAQYLQLPRQGRGSSLLLRFMILTLDFTAFVCLCINLGLYDKWASKAHAIAEDLTETEYYDGDYYQEHITIPSLRYWEDPIVIAAVLSSLLWTAFIYLRPAWTRNALHSGVKIGSELLLFLLILACSIPAFVLSPLQPARSLFYYQQGYGYCGFRYNGTVYHCGGHVSSLQTLQAAAYALVWAVAFFHLCLFCGAVYEYRHPIKVFEDEEAAKSDEVPV